MKTILIKDWNVNENVYICNMNYKDEINKRGLKITWIATKIGITRSLLSQYINGLRNMPEHVEIKLKKMLS